MDVIEDEQKTKAELPKHSSVFPGRAAQLGQAKDAQRESEKKWRFLLKSSDAIFNLERDGTVLFINHTVPGYTVEDTVGKTVYDLIPPEEHEKTRKAIEKVFQTGEAVSFETSVIGPDGNLLWYSTRLGPVKERDKVVGVAQISTDITERKKVEEARRVSEKKFRDIAERSFDKIFTTDTNGNLTYVSPDSKKIFCYKPEEMVGTHFKNYLIKSKIPRVSQRFAENMRRKKKNFSASIIAMKAI
jgi:PAS domain S-box-containing protein